MTTDIDLDSQAVLRDVVAPHVLPSRPAWVASAFCTLASRTARAESQLEEANALIRKLSRLLPGPRGREVSFTPQEHLALQRALS